MVEKLGFGRLDLKKEVEPMVLGGAWRNDYRIRDMYD
jgi:hypothetical protein